VGPTRTPAGWRSFSGRRATNQDAVVAGRLTDGRELVAVADGMGGHQGGEVASQRALETLVASLEAGRTLRDAMVDANAAVYTAAQENPAWTGMGTTVVALLRSGDRYQIANVGDSRAYRVSDDVIHQITDDHSFLAEALRAGQMAPEEARNSRWRNALTRAIGTDPAVEVDTFGPFEVQQSQTVVLCSDGLHGSIADEAMLSCLQQNKDVWGAAMCLADQAFKNGSKDNISVAVVSFAERIQVQVSGTPVARHSPRPLKLIYAPERGRERSFLQRLFTMFT
jgi:protein phosphatase